MWNDVLTHANLPLDAATIPMLDLANALVVVANEDLATATA